MGRVGIAGLALRSTGGSRAGRPMSTKELLHQKIDEVGDAAALAAMEHGGGLPGPQPHSVQDIATVSRAVVDSAKAGVDMLTTQVDSARADAEVERARRMDAEDSTGAAIAAVRAEERTAADKALEMVREVTNLRLSMTEELASLRVSVAQSEAAKIAAEMKASNDATVARLTGQIEQLQTENQALKGQVGELSRKKSAAEELGEAFLSGKFDDHPVVQTVRRLTPQPTGPVEEDPQTQLYRQAIPSVVDRLDKENSKIDRAEARADRLADAGMRLLGALERRLGGPGVLLADADLPGSGAAPAADQFIDPEAADTEYAGVGGSR